MIKYITGDATRPSGSGTKIIAHICNNHGAWGAGFVMAISKRWKEPSVEYYNLANSGKCNLGVVQLVQVAPDIQVANMVAQNGFPSHSKPIAVDYLALRVCLQSLATTAKTNSASVHMPRIGCGIGGGDWDTVEQIINDTLITAGVKVTVYNFC